MVIVLKKGEEFFSALKNKLSERKINSAFFVGLGAFVKAELAFYDLKSKKYLAKKFAGLSEALNITGNIVPADDEVFIHAHAVLSKKNFSVFGGHLKSAVVGGTLELSIFPIDEKIARKFDPETGLKLMGQKT